MLKSAYIKEYTDNLTKEIYGKSMNDSEAAKKQAEDQRKQAEDLRKQAENYVSLFVLKSLEMGMTVNEIAKTYNIPLERINEIPTKK